VVDGLIPMDIAMADVVNEFPKLEQKGFSKTSSSGAARPNYWRPYGNMAFQISTRGTRLTRGLGDLPDIKDEPRIGGHDEAPSSISR
jgi:hypothetical protein